MDELPVGSPYGREEFLGVAEEVLERANPTGISTEDFRAAIDWPRTLAALEAPFVSCERHPLYPDATDRAAILGIGIARLSLADLQFPIALLFIDIALETGAQSAVDASPLEVIDILRSAARVSEDGSGEGVGAGEFIGWLKRHTRRLRAPS